MFLGRGMDVGMDMDMEKVMTSGPGPCKRFDFCYVFIEIPWERYMQENYGIRYQIIDGLDRGNRVKRK